MKKTIFAFMALLFVIVNANAQSKKKVIPKLKGPEPNVLDCKVLRTGTFKTVLDGRITIMKRSATTEMDYVGGSKDPIVYDVKWKGDCTYVLTPKPETYKTHPDVRKGEVLTIEAFLKNTSSYTVTVTANYTKAKINMEIYKLSDKL